MCEARNEVRTDRATSPMSPMSPGPGSGRELLGPRGHYEGDHNFDVLWPQARQFIISVEDATIRGVQARCEVLKLAGLTLIRGEFHTNHGSGFDGGLYAVDALGRLHKEVGGSWVPQSRGGEASYVVRTAETETRR